MTKIELQQDIARIKKIVDGYIDGVLSGEIIACRFTKLACTRHLNDLKDAPARGLVFREDKAYHAVKFFSFLKLWKGKDYKGKEFSLAPHMTFLTWVLMGWYKTDGFRRFRKAHVEMARKGAKALALDTPVPTPHGWSDIGSLKAGDVVFDDSGAECKVISTTETFYDRYCYKVVFSDGTEIIADAGHLWETTAKNLFEGRTGKRGLRKKHTDIRTTEDIRNTIKTQPYNDKVEWNHKVGVAAAIKTSEKILPINPYSLGCWLGDGDSRAARIITHKDDYQIINEIEKDGYAASGKLQVNNSFVMTIGAFKTSTLCRRGHDKGKYRTKDGHCLLCNREVDRARREARPVPPHSVLSLSEMLLREGVRGNKHIPPHYLRASYEQRIALLQGLMDTDGTVDARGHCSFTNTNKTLASDVHELVLSLGFKSVIRETAAKIYGKECGTAYLVAFKAYSNTPVFRLKRKADKQCPPPISNQRSAYRQIIAVERVASVPVKCISVDSDRNLFLVSRSFIPTHNSSYAGGLAAYFLIADGEEAGEIYTAAVKREQAKIVWDNVKNLTQHTGFAKNIIYLTNKLTVEATNSKCEPLSSDAKSLDGLDTHFASLDELHAHPDSQVHDLVSDSIGARSQPLILIITTAGFNQTGICYETRDYLTQILKGTIQDDSFFGMIFTLDTKKDWPDLKEKKEELRAGEEHEDDWTNEDIWVKAAPGLVGITESGKKFGIDEKGNPIPGYMTKIEDMRDKSRIAKQMPSAQNNFLTKRLNIWTQSENRWIDLALWDANNIRPVTEETCRGRSCVGGIDLSAISDLTVWGLLFPDEEDKDLIDIFFRVWCPEARLFDTKNKYRDQYKAWRDGGYLTVTPGDAIDYDMIRGKIAGYTDVNGIYVPGDKDIFNIQSVSVDRGFQGYEFSQKLDAELGGTEKDPKVCACGMGWVSMNGPCQELERLLLLKKLNNGGNPIARFAADNVSVKVNPTGGGKSPNKASSQGKIDPIVVILLGLDRLLRKPAPQTSVHAGKSVEEILESMTI